MSRVPLLYQETRLSPSSSQILQISTSPEQSTPIFGAGRKRRFDEISGLDEESYSRKYLATEGSVFFRRKSRSPRSFLWRVLEDRQVLEIQSVDLVHDERTTKAESWLTFRITLPGQIVKNGVAFADPDETDALEAFVLTSDNEIYTFTLKRDLLTRKTAPNEFEPTTCFKKYASSRLGLEHPYRLVAVSSRELLISLDDGSLLQLKRQANETGTQWRDMTFSERKWSGTLRLIGLNRQQTVRYGDIELGTSTAAAMAKSPDGKYIWTITLDHQLRAWSTQTGKLVMTKDLLNHDYAEDGKKQSRYVMDAEQGNLLQVMTPPRPRNTKSVARMDRDGPYFLVVHSPKDHEFKFYEVSSTFSSVDGESIKCEDMQPGVRLIPPIDELLDTSIWHLEEFYIHPGVNWQDTQLWLRARNGGLCKVFTLTFDLLQDDDEAIKLEDMWHDGWVSVDPGMQTINALRASVDFPGNMENVSGGAVTITEEWIDFICRPGRFSIPSVESVLYIYRKGRGLSGGGTKGLNAPEPPLKERLSQAITSKINLRRLPNDSPDYDRYQSDIQGQWKSFFSLLAHLHHRREDSIGFAFDYEDALPWSVSADFVAALRACSGIDRLSLNAHLPREEVDEGVINRVFVFDDEDHTLHSQVLAVAKDFCIRLSTDFRSRFCIQAISEALSHEYGDQKRNIQRVQSLYEDNNMNAEVMEDDFQSLEDSAAHIGGLGDLSEDLILGVLELIEPKLDGLTRDRESLNRYGDKLAVIAAQETLDRDRATLLDVLMLVVFMYGDLDQADLHPEFVSQIGPIYDTLIVRLKNNEMLRWLAGKEVPFESNRQGNSSGSQVTGTDPSTVNLLERISIGDWEPRSEGGESMPELLSVWSKQWTYGAKLWTDWDGVSGHILAFLLKEQCYELAADFQKFLTNDEFAPSWIKYLQGRLLIGMGDYALASLKFQAAASEMAKVKSIAVSDTAYLLTAVERNDFGSGQSEFFHHVSTLFEKLKVFSYTADFAKLALDRLENDPKFESTMARLDRSRSMMDSPEVSRIDASMEQQSLLRAKEQARDELRSRLFNALVQTGRFGKAFDALAGIGELPIKRANLKELIEKCVKQDAVPELLALPFAHRELSQEADSILLGLAKKGLASGSAGSPPYYQILYAFRTQQSDFRGAAEILYEHLERLRHTNQKHGIQDPEEETLIQAYVLLINTLACCGQEDAWLLADPIEEVHGTGKKRRLVTIDDVRRQYGAELDKRSDILQGRFPLIGGGDEMDVL